MKDYRVSYKLNPDQWSDFVARNEQGGIFQTPEMHEVFRHSKNMEPVLIAIFDQENNLKATILACIISTYTGILGGITSRAVVWGGPVVEDSDPYWLDILLKEYVNVVSPKVIFSEVRNAWDMLSWKSTFATHGFHFAEHLNILVDLEQSVDELWSNVHSKRRNEIRKATKRGTTFAEIKQESQVLETFDILKEVYHNANLPLADKSMFTAAYKYLAPKGMIRFFTAINDGRIIGTIIVLCYKGVIFDWYAGSYRNHYQDHPNDLLPWEVFLWGKKNGYTLFDFGGAGDPNIPYGVRDYKLKFNKNLVHPGRYVNIHKPWLYKIATMGFKFYQTLKSKT